MRNRGKRRLLLRGECIRFMDSDDPRLKTLVHQFRKFISCIRRKLFIRLREFIHNIRKIIRSVLRIHSWLRDLFITSANSFSTSSIHHTLWTCSSHSWIHSLHSANSFTKTYELTSCEFIHCLSDSFITSRELIQNIRWIVRYISRIHSSSLNKTFTEFVNSFIRGVIKHSPPLMNSFITSSKRSLHLVNSFVTWQWNIHRVLTNSSVTFFNDTLVHPLTIRSTFSLL